MSALESYQNIHLSAFLHVGLFLLRASLDFLAHHIHHLGTKLITIISKTTTIFTTTTHFAGYVCRCWVFPGNQPTPFFGANSCVYHTYQLKIKNGAESRKPYHDPQSPSLSCHLTKSAIINQVIKLNYQASCFHPVVLLFSPLFLTNCDQISASPNITKYPAHLVSRPPGSGIEVKLSRRSCCRLPHFCLLLR